MSTNHPFLSLILALLISVVVLAVVLMLLGVPEDIVLYVCFGVEILVGLVALFFLIRAWVRK